jgi:hypothetical protein
MRQDLRPFAEREGQADRRPHFSGALRQIGNGKSAYVNRFQKLLDHERPAHWLFPRNHVRYNLQEWFSLEKLLDKNEARIQIGKRVKRRICRPEQSRLGTQPNDRFIPEVGAKRMFASLTLSSCRLSRSVTQQAPMVPEMGKPVRQNC